MFSTGATLASLITGEDIFRIEGSDGKTKHNQCRRVLDSMSAALGPISESALNETETALSDEDKPQKADTEETSSLKGRLSKSRFFLGLLKKCLDYTPSRRPTAFQAYKLVFARATEEQKEAMRKFTKEEKEAAERNRRRRTCPKYSESKSEHCRLSLSCKFTVLAFVSCLLTLTLQPEGSFCVLVNKLSHIINDLTQIPKFSSLSTKAFFNYSSMNSPHSNRYGCS